MKKNLVGKTSFKPQMKTATTSPFPNAAVNTAAITLLCARMSVELDFHHAAYL